MPPTLSIIITNYNYTEKLPRLFENIMSQTISDYEVALVDDCSDIPCDGVVEKYRNKGLPVVLCKSNTRRYTKDARLDGIEAAGGDLVAFIDADDWFYGQKVLEYHVNQALEERVDILHFSMVHYENGKVSKQRFPWTAPLAERLIGENIFRTYVSRKLQGFNIWGKIFTRDLWLRCMEPGRASTVRRYGEDVALCSLLMFHARSYYGSARLGYAREWVVRAPQKSFGRSITFYTLLREFIPYIQEHGADALTCQALREIFLESIKVYTIMNIDYQRSKGLEEVDDWMITEMLEHGSPEKIIRALMTGLL